MTKGSPSEWELNLRAGQGVWLDEKSRLTEDVSHRGTATGKLWSEGRAQGRMNSWSCVRQIPVGCGRNGFPRTSKVLYTVLEKKKKRLYQIVF